MNVLKMSVNLAITLALLLGSLPAWASAQAVRPEGPCDIYAGDHAETMTVATVSGTDITFTDPLAKAHPAGTALTAKGDLATPGAPNNYVRRGE